MHLLDGQQRMTALWRSLTGHYDDLSLFVSLREAPESAMGDEAVDDVPEVVAEKRWIKQLKGKSFGMPIWTDDDVQVFGRNLLPIACLRPGVKGTQRLKEFKAAVSAAGGDVTPFDDYTYELRQRVSSYSLACLELPVGTGKETALDVFIKMNTSASALSDFDIVVAQLEEAMGQSLHAMVEELKQRVPAITRYGNVEDNVLAVAALLNDRPGLKATFLIDDFGKQLANVWPRLEQGFERGLEFLRLEGILGEKTLPSEVAVYLTCALWADVPEYGYDHEGNARTLIRKALWRACCTNRYIKTATTRAYADYRILAALIAGKPVPNPPELFDTLANPLPEAGELIVASWPTRKDRLPRAMLSIALRNGSLDCADAAPATPGNIGRREYHHIAGFPEGTQESEIFRALNCALITWRTNRKLSATSPTDYIRARTEQAMLGETEVRQRLASHIVPYAEMSAGDYAKFMEKRAALMVEAIAALCDGAEPNLGIS